MTYIAIVSSDWNECLAPCGPFDPISFAFPELTSRLSEIFVQYTGNEISLTEATRRIAALMPAPISQKQMDDYLQASYSTYRGVPELIEWCRSHDILFMINTTGVQGYFQRVFARKLLPAVPIVAANPLIRFPGVDDDPRYEFAVKEIEDKPKHTQEVIRSHGIHPSRVIVIGDSGGDGPHFAWGASNGGMLIGSMLKPSLQRFCEQRNIKIDLRFGFSNSRQEAWSIEQGMEINFMSLAHEIERFLDNRWGVRRRFTEEGQ